MVRLFKRYLHEHASPVRIKLHHLLYKPFYIQCSSSNTPILSYLSCKENRTASKQ